MQNDASCKTLQSHNVKVNLIYLNNSTIVHGIFFVNIFNFLIGSIEDMYLTNLMYFLNLNVDYDIQIINTKYAIFRVRCILQTWCTFKFNIFCLVISYIRTHAWENKHYIISLNCFTKCQSTTQNHLKLSLTHPKDKMKTQTKNKPHCLTQSQLFCLIYNLPHNVLNEL